MEKITLSQLKEMMVESKDTLYQKAKTAGRFPKIYLHWTAGGYNTCYDDYHICITGTGAIYAMTDDLSEVLYHTWKRNTGSIGIALCCGKGAGSNDLGECPPTKAQIESMAQVTAAICNALEIPIDKEHVLTHGEAADNEDGISPHKPYAWWDDGYGDGDTRGDLEYLGTPESPSYNPDATDGSRGGDVLRGKAIWYQNYWREHE